MAKPGGGWRRIEAVRRRHRLWSRIQTAFSIPPLFALVNHVQPMVTDGYGRDPIPGLLPAVFRGHYGALLAVLASAIALSECLRRRYRAAHRDELDL